MIVNEEWVEWLEHRAGVARSETVAVARLQRSLTQGDSGREEMDSFGRSEILAFAGYVRLARYGHQAAHGSAHDLAAFLKPYRRLVRCLLSEAAALVQVLPEDGLFFLLPDPSEDNGVRADRTLGALLEDLAAVPRRLGEAYGLRVGLGFGEVALSRSEDGWEVDGTALHLASELLRLPQLAQPGPFGAALGVALPEVEKLPFAGTPMALCGRRLTPHPLPDPFHVGPLPTRAAVLLPR